MSFVGPAWRRSLQSLLREPAGALRRACPYHNSRSQFLSNFNCARNSSYKLSRQHRTFASKSTPPRKPSSKQPTPSKRPTESRPPKQIKTNVKSYVAPKDIFAHDIAQKSSPTLLYAGPLNNTHATVCAVAGGFSIAYGLFHLHDALLLPHPGLWWVIPYLNAGVAVFMIGCGVWIGLGGRRMASTVRAVPTKTQQRSGLELMVEGREWLQVPVFWKRPLEWRPLIPRKIIICRPQDVRLGPGLEQSLELRHMDRGIDIRKGGFRDQVLGPIMRPFRALFYSIRRIVGRDGFVNLYVGKKPWRLDVKSGWLLDDGQALERILKSRIK